MANEYCFHCPIKSEGVKLTHCEAVHSASMQGRPHEIEDKVCALAHTAWMCPARNAFRVGGPWSHYDTKPFADEPPAKPAKLPKDLELYALSHTPPRDPDYRKCGMRGDDVGVYDDLFRNLNARAIGQGGSDMARPNVSSAPKQTRSAPKKSKRPEKPKTPETAADVIGQGGDDMAAAVTELAKKEAAERKAQKSPQKRKSQETPNDAPEAKKAPQRANQEPSDAPKRKMSLAERAKQMKARKSA